jgi:hypothetical protein
MLSVSMDGNRRLTLLNQTHLEYMITLTPLANISLSNPSNSVTSSNNLLAYRPRFSDVHNSNLAAVFINMEGVFPCTQSLSNYYPVCSTYSEEMDFAEEKLYLVPETLEGSFVSLAPPRIF